MGRAGRWKGFFAVVLCAVAGHAEEQSGEAGWRVWLEPKFMHAPVTVAIPGAGRTELAAGTRDEHGDVSLLRPQFEELKTGWESFVAKARTNADAELATLKPSYVRDKKQVIEYAVLSSEKPVVASAVFAAKFLDLFKETLGEKVLVVVPSRFKAFVFPALASRYEEYAPMVFEAYRATAFPVSVEVFEVSAEGWKAAGVYEEQ